MKRTLLFASVAALVLTGCTVNISDTSCNHSAPINTTLDASTAAQLVVHSQVGKLQIYGSDDIDSVKVTGQACATSLGALDRINVETSTDHGKVELRTVLPSMSNVWIDLQLAVPAHMDVQVTSGTGSVEVQTVRSLKLESSTGSVLVTGIAGDTDLRTGTGSVEVRDLKGNLTASSDTGSLTVQEVGGKVYIPEKGTGSMDIRQVQSDVHIAKSRTGSIDITSVKGDVQIEEKGTGSIDIRTVTGSVLIGRSSTGRIDVRDVSGNFTVRSKGTGSIDYGNIGGRVDIPSNK